VTSANLAEIGSALGAIWALLFAAWVIATLIAAYLALDVPFGEQRIQRWLGWLMMAWAFPLIGAYLAIKRLFQRKP